MSSTAQGVTAVKQCRFPPCFGYKTDVSHGAVKTLSTANFASLATTKKNENKNNFKIWMQKSRMYKQLNMMVIILSNVQEKIS